MDTLVLRIMNTLLLIELALCYQHTAQESSENEVVLCLTAQLHSTMPTRNYAGSS